MSSPCSSGSDASSTPIRHAAEGEVPVDCRFLDFDNLDTDVIDDAVRAAKKQIVVDEAEDKRLKKLNHEPKRRRVLSPEEELIYALAKRELEAESPSAFVRQCKWRDLCAGVRQDDTPSTRDVSPKQRFFEKRGLDPRECSKVAAAAMIDKDFADQRRLMARVAKDAAHRRYVDGDVGYQSIERWKTQHRLDVREIMLAEEVGADIEEVAAKQVHDAAEVLRVLKSRFVYVMAPTRRSWFYSSEEHETLRRAIGYSESKYQLAQTTVHKNYETFADTAGSKFHQYPEGIFRVVMRESRPKYLPKQECPLSFFRNMMKRERTNDNVLALLERFLTLSYSTDCPDSYLGEPVEYTSDVDISRVDGVVENLFDHGLRREYKKTNFTHWHSNEEFWRKRRGVPCMIKEIPFTFVELERLVYTVTNLDFSGRRSISGFGNRPEDDGYDFHTRRSGLTPFAITDGCDECPKSPLHLVTILNQYLIVLEVLFGHKHPNPFFEVLPTFHHYRSVRTLRDVLNSQFWEHKLSHKLLLHILWETHVDARLHFSNTTEKMHVSYGIERLYVWLREYRNNYDENDVEERRKLGNAEPILDAYDTPRCPYEWFLISYDNEELH